MFVAHMHPLWLALMAMEAKSGLWGLTPPRTSGLKLQSLDWMLLALRWDICGGGLMVGLSFWNLSSELEVIAAPWGLGCTGSQGPSSGSLTTN